MVYCGYKQETWQHMSKQEVLALCLFICSAALVTLCLNRPDSDDQTYLGISILVLDYAEIPLRLIPSSVFKSGYAFSSHELLKSALTYSTGIPILFSHYLIIPAFLSSFVILIHWKLLKLLIGKKWVIGIVFFFIVMLAWGDIHRTHANFGLVRLFQGKACFVSIIIPGIIYYFLKYHETSQKKYALLLFFTIISGVGFTPTAIIVGPLTLGVLLIANIQFDRNQIKKHLLLATALLVPLSVGLLIIFYYGNVLPGVHTAQGVRQHTTNYEMLQFVLGNGYRGIFALVCFAISPLFITNHHVKKGYRNFVLVCLLLLAVPWTSEIIARSTHYSASWRWLWMLPMPLAMCIVMGSLTELYHNKRKMPVGYICVIMLSLVFILSSKRLVISQENYTEFTWPAFKIPNQEKIWIRSYEEYGFIRNNYIYMKKSNKEF